MTGIFRVFAFTFVVTLAWLSAVHAQEALPTSTTSLDRAVARAAFEQLPRVSTRV
jgi:hypothetical protein